VINPRLLAIVLYVFLMVMIASQLPINEYTLGMVAAVLAVLVAGLGLLLGAHYIIPYVKRNWRMGECHVRNMKYLICEAGTAGEKVGYVYIKVVPEQPVSDMEKERREAFLQTVLGLLSGTQFEAAVMFIVVKDRYGDNIRKRLEEMKSRLLLFSFRESARTRDILEMINRALALLRQVPVILEGFYVAVVRDYDHDEHTLIQKLEADSRALMSRLSGMGVSAQEIKGEELWVVMRFMQFGSVAQVTWL